MYVPPEALTTVADRHLNPLESPSIDAADVSAPEVSASNVADSTLYVSLDVSQMYQSDVLSVRLTITHLG